MKLQNLLLSIGLAFVFNPSLSGYTDAAETISDLPESSLSIQINEPVEKVWRAIQLRRSSDSLRRKLISYDGKVAVVEEQFPAMPVIGDTVCRYEEDEVIPFKLLDYKLLSSDHLRIFEGDWRLAPGRLPNTTVVSLTSTIDPGIRFPFWRRIAQAEIVLSVRDNLREVSRLACANLS